MRSRELALPELELFEIGEDPESLRAAGPSIGPIHDRVLPPKPELRKGVPPGAVLSPLAITLRGLRNAGATRQKVSQIVVHMTGSGPVQQSKKAGYARPAIDYALNWYLNGDGGFPHYVVDFPGTIYATCDERRAAWHAGWVHTGGKARFQSATWQSPSWWTSVWGRFGFRSPIELLPQGASGPNSRSIGIELLVTSKPSFTDAQYRALAQLIADIARRHNIPIASAPGPTLLGHEDYAPVPTEQKGRANAAGGWDPGAHRINPYFSWSKLWGYLKGSGALAQSAPMSSPLSSPAPSPSPSPLSTPWSSSTPMVIVPSADLVRFAQRVLNFAEGEMLVEDGDLGPGTKAALARFSSQYGLSPGPLSSSTAIALVQRTLEELQQQSMFEQFGVFDSKTQSALAAFRSSHGLVFSPSLDAATYAALGSALANAVVGRLSASQYRKFRLTAYNISDQRERPTGAVRIPFYDPHGRKIAEGSPSFFADASLEGTGRLVDKRLINVTGRVSVTHAEYEPVLTYLVSKGKSLGTHGIFVDDNKHVTQAHAFTFMPPGPSGYGRQHGIDMQRFRTLAADPKYVPIGTRVYIREFAGKLLPGGLRHDGWFVVNDTGGKIKGVHFDVFVGERALQPYVPQSGGSVWFPGIEKRIPAGFTFGL